jgi:hypothetical protein
MPSASPSNVQNVQLLSTSPESATWQCYCGSLVTISSRRSRDHVRLGTNPRCQSCWPIARIVVTDALRTYWLERYSPDEIRDLAAGIWS